jgi:hypothetical protein
LPSTPWESVGEAGWEKEFEVEELFPACPPSSSSFRGIEFLTSEQDFPVIYSREMDHLLQGTEVLPLVNVARWGIRNGLSLRGTPGRMNEDSEIG